jgi:hypothetical protein
MRLLLDESLPKKLRASLPGHSVSTVVEMGWGGTKNGALLALASSQFDAFLTADQNLPYQQKALDSAATGRAQRLGPEVPHAD